MPFDRSFLKKHSSLRFHIKTSFFIICDCLNVTFQVFSEHYIGSENVRFLFFLLVFLRFGKHKSKFFFAFLKFASTLYFYTQFFGKFVIDIFAFLFAVFRPLKILLRLPVIVEL